MFSVSANSRATSPTSETPLSLLPMDFDSPSNTNGEPIFAQVVLDALKGATSNAATQTSLPLKTPDTTPCGQAPSSRSSIVPNQSKNTTTEPALRQIGNEPIDRSVSNAASQRVPISKATDSTPAGSAPQSPRLLNKLNNMFAKVAEVSKQTNKLQTQPSSSDPVLVQEVSTPVAPALPTVLVQRSLSGIASPERIISENTTVALPSPAEPDESAVRPVDAGNVTVQSFSQLPAKRVVNSPAPVAVPTADFISFATLPKPTNAASIPPPLARMATPSMEVGASPVSKAAVQVSAISTTPQVSTSTALAPATTLKNEIVPQVSGPSLNPSQGRPLSSVAQQIAELQETASNHIPAPVVLVDLSRTAAQPQLALVAEKAADSSSSLVHTSAAASNPVLSSAKGDRSTSAEAGPIEAKQNVTSATNNHCPLQDSSSNHSGQKAPDSPTPSDSAGVPIPQAKNEPVVSSAALSFVSIPKPDATPAAQVSSTTMPAFATPPPPSEPSLRHVAEPIASAPAQAQLPAPAQQSPDAPSARFVNDAQLTSTANQSEMHIAVQTNKLGAIEIHTRVSGNEVGAAIIVEKRDAHAALAIELPALQQALSDKQLRVEQVALSHGSLSSTTGDAGASPQHNQRGTSQSPQSHPFWNEARTLSTAAWFVPEQTGIFNAQGRLSVQA